MLLAVATILVLLMIWEQEEGAAVSDVTAATHCRGDGRKRKRRPSQPVTTESIKRKKAIFVQP